MGKNPQELKMLSIMFLLTLVIILNIMQCIFLLINLLNRNSEPILMMPFDNKEPIRLIDAVQTDYPKGKLGQSNVPSKSAVP